MTVSMRDVGLVSIGIALTIPIGYGLLWVMREPLTRRVRRVGGAELRRYLETETSGVLTGFRALPEYTRITDDIAELGVNALYETLGVPR